MITNYDKYIKSGYRPIERDFTTKEEIEDWLNKTTVYKKGYTINNDLTVDVSTYIHLNNKHLTYLPFKFNYCKNSFFIHMNKLRNFNNFPNVIDGELNIANNRFKSLKGLPIIKGYLYLSSNPLEDITDLSVDDMIKNLKNKQFGIESIKRKVIDNYFEFYINKDIRIVKALEKYISNDMKDKYKHYYEANKFDIF